MSSGAAMAKAADPALVFWARLQNEIETRVRECNIDAEEALWGVARSPGAPMRMAVESRVRPADRIDCRFDEQSGTLECRSGRAEDAGVLRFQWRGGRMLKLGREVTASEASRLILDELAVCADDD